MRMNHEQIKRDDVVDRYVLGELNPELETAFEEHYFGCDQCFRELEATERMAHAVQEGFEQRELHIAKVKNKKGFWLFDLFRVPALSPALATVTSVCVLVLLYPAWRGIVTLPELERSVEQLQRPQANVQSIYLQ